MRHVSLALILALAPSVSLKAQMLQSIVGAKPTVASAPIAQIAKASATDASSATTGTINSTGANLGIAVGSSYLDTPCSNAMSDSKGNSWSCIVSDTSQDPRTVIWCAQLASVGSGHTFTLTGVAVALSVSVWSNASASACSGAQSTHNGTASANSLLPGSITPGANGALVVTGNSTAQYLADYDWAVTTGYTNIHTINSAAGVNIPLGAWYQIQTTATATNAPWASVTTTTATAVQASFAAQ